MFLKAKLIWLIINKYKIITINNQYKTNLLQEYRFPKIDHHNMYDNMNHYTK